MTEFKVHSTESADPDSRKIFEQAEQAFGLVPNLYRVLAESPKALEAYHTLNNLFEQSSLSGAEQQVVLLTISFRNECRYCMAAHSAVANMVGLPEHEIEALRTGKPLQDRKLGALRAFADRLVEKRGWVDQEDINAFLSAGYDKSTLLEVILGVTQKTLSNYVNHIAETPVDEPFQQFTWKKAG